MYCDNCGAEIGENERFCGKCGNDLSYYQNNAQTQSKPEKQGKLKKRIIALALVVCLIITGGIIISQNTLEKRLMKNTWWSEISFNNEESYDKEVYWVTANCERITFCFSGNVRREDFGFGWGAYQTSYKVTADNMPGDFEFFDVSSSNGGTWELLDNKELLYNDKYYEWDKDESEDTWYLKGDTLRIGENYYSAENPGVKVSEEVKRISYWCANCGEEGPFDDRECPECECEEKIKCDY